MKVYNLDVWQFVKDKFKSDKNLPTDGGNSPLFPVVHDETKNKLDCRLIRSVIRQPASYESIPDRLDDILHGISRADIASTRGLSKLDLFTLLTQFDILRISDIMDCKQCTENHARKIFRSCRIAVRAIDREIKQGTLGNIRYRSDNIAE